MKDTLFLEKPFWEKPWYWKEKLDPVFPFYLWNGVWNFKGNAYPTHWQRSFEIFTVLEGNTDVYVNGEIYSLQKDDILVINPELIHGYINQSCYTHYIVFLFGAEIFDQSLVDIRDKINLTTIFSKKTLLRADIDGKLHKRLIKNILSISDEFIKMKEGYHTAVRKYLYDIALLFLRDLPPVEAPSKKAAIEISHYKILERVLSFIHNNYENPDITLEQGAEIAALSKFYFSRFFRERTGLTFHAYLSRMRINQALELLSETDLPVTNIAYDSGFSSIKTFNRLFKSTTGISPSQCRSGIKGMVNERKQSNF